MSSVILTLLYKHTRMDLWVVTEEAQIPTLQRHPLPPEFLRLPEEGTSLLFMPSLSRESCKPTISEQTLPFLASTAQPGVPWGLAEVSCFQEAGGDLWTSLCIKAALSSSEDTLCFICLWHSVGVAFRFFSFCLPGERRFSGTVMGPWKLDAFLWGGK